MSKDTILVVDDLAENLDVVRGVLADDYKVKAAINGQIALKIIQGQKPDLILLDINMPGMDGYELCQRLKDEPATKDIPVIFVTGQESVANEALGLEMGAVDYIKKPINPPILLARLRAHLNLADARDKLREHKNNLEQLVEEKIVEVLESKVATIHALAKLTSSRDEETGKHLSRTQKYCHLLATKLGEYEKYSSVIDQKYCDNIYRVSPLHDIGKVAIPDKILLKPAQLTEDEFETIKTHTVVGAETLSEVREQYNKNDFISMGIDIVRSHHEKWDGSGYPDALAGVEIPLAARIMAIADVYDALRTKRPYKDAFSHSKSKEIIVADKGSHFEPFLVEAFLELESKFKAISIEWGD